MGFWVLRLEFKPQIWNLGFETGMGGGMKEEKEKEKIPLMCESIGHRPLWGRCPKGKIHMWLQLHRVTPLGASHSKSLEYPFTLLR